MYKVPAAPLVKPQPIPSPLTVGGCGIWLDSTDTSAASMTFSSGQNLSVWKDKSGNGNNFSALQGVPTVINDGAQTVVNFANTGSDATEPIMKSANQITWNASSAFFIVSKLTTTTFAYVLAFSDIGGSDHSIRFTNGNLTGTAGYAGNFDDMTNSYYVNGNFNPNYTSSSYLNKYAIIDTVAPFINNGTTSYLTLSGGAIYQRYFFGNIAEFIYYPAGVSEIQRQQIEGYLAIKWGLQDSLPAGHPGLFGVPPTTMTFVQQPGLIWHDSRVLNRQYPPPYTPVNLYGLQLWMDAADSSTLTLSGSTVTAWKDKSGKNNNTTLKSGSPQLTAGAINGKAAISMSGGWFTGPFAAANTGTQTHSFAIASMDTNSGSYARIFSLGRPGINDFIDTTTHFAFIRNSGQQQVMIGRNAQYDSVPFPNYSSPFLVQSSQNGNMEYIGVNGSLTPQSLDTNIYDNFNITSYGIGINTNTGNYYAWNGLCAEILCYNYQLDDTERQKVEGYLAWKWGLQGSLPSGHPWKLLAPP